MLLIIQPAVAQITQATVIWVLIAATLFVIGLLVLIAIIGVRADLENRKNYFFALGSMAALFGLLIALPLALLTTLLGTAVGYVSTFVGPYIGVLLGAGVSHSFTSHREKAQEKREKQSERRELLGLLNLVHVEVVNNLELLKTMGPQSGSVMRGTEKLKRGTDNLEARKLSIDSWEQTRTRIAALLDDENRLRHLISGYAALSALKHRLLNPDTDKLNEQEYEETVAIVRSHQWSTFEVCQQETGMFWEWSEGMLVSKPAKKRAEAEQTDS